MKRRVTGLHSRLAAAGLHLVDVPVEFSTIASRGLRRRIGADAMARMHHLMNGAPVHAPHLVTDAGRALRVRFLVARIKRAPDGTILGPVWIEGGPLRATYLALADLTHRDCIVCDWRPHRVGSHSPATEFAESTHLGTR
ncbi:hypothetical protein [Luteipulveratus mongoliensis]|uniref:Uncharacterized protein n=1 Tax=Luteipulveratus mongoliensis TaxID=571913 RepID=A0A0K1JDI2_9MICO|nr:hypothetical protein [Luteipulveratus mongoliensis]AKU14756.1 hypothetical protein VV02_00810 [Luteipulveratus mongoliensis]